MPSALTRQARGRDCLIRLNMVCLFHSATVVACHANGISIGKGMGMKSNDLLIAYGCAACHDVYDRRRPLPAHLTREQVEVAFWEGHARTLVLLHAEGFIRF